MLLQVHDGIGFEAPIEKVEVATPPKPKWNLPWKHKFHFWWKLGVSKSGWKRIDFGGRWEN